MTTSISLIDFLLNLLRDPEARAEFLADNDGYLASCGLGDLNSDDIHDALVLLQDNDDADFSRDHNTGGNSVTVVTPPPVHHHDGDDDGDDHAEAIEYLNTYITNNYVDDRDTIVDNSVNQQIDTDGGDFDQEIDIDAVTASGDGAVAAGDDIEDSTITTGDDNQVGDGNIRGDGNVVGDDNEVLNGDDNTASFGDGDANSASFEDVDVSEGGALAVGGDAEGDSDVEGSYNEFESTTNTDIHNEDSFNFESDTDVNSNNESTTEVEVDSHDDVHSDVLSHNDVEL